MRESEEKMEVYSRRTDEKMDKFLQTITDSVGTQLRGMNSTIVKMKEEDDRYKQISERIMNMEQKIIDIDEKIENRSYEPSRAHGDQNRGKAVIIGFHNETSESEVIQLLKETITEKGMTIENARIECSAKPITHAFIHFWKNDERNKYISSANMLKKEVRGRTLKITRSMDAEERFHKNGECQMLHSRKTQHSSRFDIYELDTEARISQRPDSGENMPKRKPHVHQIPRHRNRSRRSNGKWQSKKLIATTVKTKR